MYRHLPNHNQQICVYKKAFSGGRFQQVFCIRQLTDLEVSL